MGFNPIFRNDISDSKRCRLINFLNRSFFQSLAVQHLYIVTDHFFQRFFANTNFAHNYFPSLAFIFWFLKHLFSVSYHTRETAIL